MTLLKNALRSLPALALLAAAAVSFGQAQKFDLRDPKGVSSVTFFLDSRLEPLNGRTTGITGDVTFDPSAPEKTRGRIVIDVLSLKMPVQGMDGHLHGRNWLDSENHKEITFTIQSVADVKKVAGADAAWTGNVTGDLTIKGTTKRVTIPVTLTHLPGQLGARVRDAQGDLVVIRSNFSLDRTEYGVNGPSPMFDVVGRNIDVRIAIVGVAPKK